MIGGFIKKEFAQIFRDKRTRIILFVLPIIQTIVFAIALSSEVKDIKIGLDYRPDDREFVSLIKHFEKSGWFKAVALQGDGISQLKSGELDAILVSPLQKVLKDKDRFSGGFQLIIDGANIIRAQSIERYVNAVLLRSMPLEPRPRVEFSIRTLYNPEMKSSFFLIPGMMSMIVALVTILLTSMSLSREKEMGTLEMILVSPIKSWELVLGKTVPFFILGLINAASILFIAIVLFRVPMEGSYLLLFLSVICFVFTTVNIGTFISTFTRNQQQAMLAGFFFLFMANLLAGIMFPIDQMPNALKGIVYINPLRIYVELLRGIMLKNASLQVTLSSLFLLLSIGSIISYLSYRRLKTYLS